MADITIHESETEHVEAAAHDDHGHGDHGGAHVTATGLSNNKMAMWLFLGSECLLFGGLISTYMLYRGRHEVAKARAPVRRRCSTFRSPRSAVSSC